MKKKVKKIPKYYNGELAVGLPDFSNYKINTRQGVAPPSSPNINYSGNEVWSDMTVNQKSAAVGNAISGVATLANVATSGQDVTVGGALSAIGAGASAGAAFGPIGARVGAALGAIAGTAGRKAGYDENSASTSFKDIYDPGSGWLGGLSDKNAARIGANMVQNNNIAKIQTEQMRAKYAMNPNNPNGGSIMAAEGGIMRQPVDALVSPGEIAINPYTLEYRQFGSDNEEPNSKDNIRTVLKTGDNVKSHAEHMIMPNGKTPADNSKMVLDSNMPEEMKRKMIKKIDNWESAHRTKPQEYAKFDEGTPKVRIRRKEPLQAVEWNGKTGYFTADGGFIELPPNPALWPDSVYLGRYDYVDKNKVQKSSNKGVHTSNELNFNTSRHTRDGVNDKVVSKANKARKTPTQEEINAFYGYDREKVVETERKDRSERINNKNRKYLVENENENEMAGTLAEVVVTAPRINKASSKKDGKKSSSGKKTDVPQSQGATPTEVNQIGLDWARQEAARTMSQYAPNTTRPIAPGLVTPKIDPTETVEEAALPGSGTKGPQGSTRTGLNGSNWRDGLYRMAVLSQPLWDRAEAEPVNYESPVYKYMPTQIDVSSQLRDTDQSYALARYNFANLYPNTGAGMAAGLQAAQNRAKQYADIRQWQTNAQNELIGKNVGIYNNWANEHARIMNEVYNKTAANRAAARNINRQNRAAALSNYGQMLSDDKKMAMERMKFNILKPAIKSTYEDATANDLINMYNSLFV